MLIDVPYYVRKVGKEGKDGGEMGIKCILEV